MSTRFIIRRSTAELARLFRIAGAPAAASPRYNVAPMQEVLTVRFDAESKKRRLDALRWGLVPHWSNDISIGPRLINAPVEGIAEAPAFRDAFAARRCLIPADGFYEWKKAAGNRLPYAILPRGAEPFVFAGLWEEARETEKGAVPATCTILTGPANRLIADIHDRMPIILEKPDWPAWLGERAASTASLLSLLKPASGSRMRTYPIGPRINSLQADDPGLIEPLAS